MTEMETTWRWEEAIPLTRVVVAHFEQNMKKPTIDRAALTDSIAEAFGNLTATEALELSYAGISEVLQHARPGQIERATFELARFGGGSPRLMDLAGKVAEHEALGKLYLSTYNISFLAAYALSNMVESLELQPFET